MTKRERTFLMAAVAGICAAVSSPPVSVAAEDKADVKCWGVNSCEGKGAVTDADVKAFKELLGEKEYGSRFGKTETHTCSALGKCGAEDHILNWEARDRGRLQGQEGVRHRRGRAREEEGGAEGLATPRRASQRPDQQGQDETERQQSGEDLEGRVVDVDPIGPRGERGPGVPGKLRDDGRARHGGGAPRGQERAVNGADVLGAEDVREKRRDGGEPAAVHREYGEEAGFKHRPAPGGGQPRNQQEENQLGKKKIV